MLDLYDITARVLAFTLLTISGFSFAHERLTEVQSVIVGSGISGIAAATRLLENGIDDIVILEAENRTGGRLRTVKFGEAVLELGCQWVHGEEGNEVFRLASQHGLMTPSIIKEDLSLWTAIDSDGNVISKNVSETFLHILREVTYSTPQLINYTDSLGTYFDQQYPQKLAEYSLSDSNLAKPFLDFYHKAQNILDASDSWYQTSGRGLALHILCSGSQMWAWKSGYSKLLDILMKKIPDPSKELPLESKTLLNKEVTKIKWDNLSEENKDKIIVECSDGSAYIANHAIVTVSLGVLKERAHSLFEPKLPEEKLKAIKGLGFGTVDKIYMKFPYKWWPEDFTEFAILRTSNDTSCDSQGKQNGCWTQGILEFSAVDNQPQVLCAFVTGAAARRMEQLTDEEVKEEIVRLLNRFLGKAYSVSVPPPDTIMRTKWSSEPHFRGSYSHRSMETEALKTSASDLAEPITNSNGNAVLLFAGEATHSHFYSTAHGALETGWREADRIMELQKLRKPST